MKLATRTLPIVALTLLGQTPQTRIDRIRQIKIDCPGANGPTVLMNNGAGVMTCIAIDGTTLKITNGVLSAALPSVSGAIQVRDIVPAGVVDGNNAVFTLPNIPLPNTLEVHVNGVYYSTANLDFALNGATITFAGTSIPSAGSSILASFQH